MCCVVASVTESHLGISRGLYASLAAEAAGSSLHCGEVNETSHGVGDREGAQVHSLPATCTPQQSGEPPHTTTSLVVVASAKARH
jgi:hypothetical protein